uniref:Uncharacterized protein n=1 Tax=Cacopsylla melanoneura TaxID=428564 RepID=A0A8D9AQJ8_9HEMI
MNSLKRLDSNNTSNYDQHNKLSVYDAKKYSTRSCQNHRIQQISHHGNRYNSCYYPARMDQRCTKYTRMQLESINMQTFNEHKITTNIDEKKWAKEEKKMSKEERKMSKEDQKLERKLSSPYKYQKFNEGDKGRNSGEEFIQSEDFSDPNIIVIEGRKRSATFDKNKINIEQMESEMGIQDDKFESMDDITDSNQTENSKITETIESTDTGDGKRKTSLDDEIDDNINRSNGANTSNNSNNGTPEESIKTKRLSIETGNNRTDTQEINIELINKKSITENRTDKELSILDTITDELVKTENHYDQIQRKIETQNDVHMGIEIVDEGLNSETTIESNKINGTVQTKKVIIDENATIKQPNDKHTNGMPLNDDYQNSILTLEEFQTQPNFNNKESIYGSMTGSPTAYYTGNTENNREVNHQNNNSTTEGINKLHRKESGHNRNSIEVHANQHHIQSNNVNSKHTVENSIKYTENDAITHHIELATNNSAKEANKPNTNDVLSQPNVRCDELSNDLKNHVEFNDNNSYSNLNNAYCNDAYEEEKDIELESNARNQNNNPIFVTDVKLQTQNNMECLIPTDNELYSVKEITNEIEISRSNRNISQYNTGNNEDLKDNQNSIKPRSQSLRMEDSSRKTSSMFNSFKWRSKSKDRESKPSETVRNVDELRFQFEIFDINIIRTGNEDGSGNPSKKI